MFFSFGTERVKIIFVKNIRNLCRNLLNKIEILLFIQFTDTIWIPNKHFVWYKKEVVFESILFITELKLYTIQLVPRFFTSDVFSLT